MRECDIERALIEEEMNRIVRTGRQPGNGKNKTKGKNNSFTMGHKKSYDDRSSESISDAASNN